jgi:hypothetical protein
MRSPRLFAWAARAARTLQHVPGARRVGPLAAWTAARELRLFASQSFRELWRAGLNRE